MHKAILPFISFVIFLLVIYIYHLSTQSSEHTITTKTIHVENEENKTIQDSIKKTVEAIKKSPTPLTKKPVISKQPTLKTSEQLTLYESLSLEEAQLSTKVRKNITPISAIKMNPNTLKQLNIQDTIILVDIEGVDYPLTVTHTQINSDGSVTTTGSYTDEGISYTTTMTQSDNESFISLATAQGLYEIETSHGVGYVYKTSDIRKQLQHSTVNDVIILSIPQ